MIMFSTIPFYEIVMSSDILISMKPPKMVMLKSWKTLFPTLHSVLLEDEILIILLRFWSYYNAYIMSGHLSFGMASS